MKVIKIKFSLSLLAMVVVTSGCVESNTVDTNADFGGVDSFDTIVLPPSVDSPLLEPEIDVYEEPVQVEPVLYEDLAQIKPDVVASNSRWIAVNAPLAEVRAAADSRLKAWLDRPSELPVFDLSKPQPPIIEPPITLVKGEFETTFQFEERIKLAQIRYDEAVDAQLKQYELGVKQYNDSVAAYKQAVQIEEEARQTESENLLWQLIYEELQLTLGQPYLQNALYDADSERFLAELVATDPRFSYLIAVDVPLEIAPEFKQNLDQATPLVAFALDASAGLAISDMAVQFNGDNYAASIFDVTNIKADKRRLLKSRDNFKALTLDEVSIQ